ncbi:MAG TPA: AMP-binding protein [Telluria sp.]
MPNMTDPNAAAGGVIAHVAAPTPDGLLAIVRQLVSETHPDQTREVTLHTSFERDLGLDSLARAELMQRVGQAFGVELPSAALSEADTALALLRYLGNTPDGTAAAGTAQVLAELAGASATALPADAQTLIDVLEWHAARQPDRVHILLCDERGYERPLRHRQLLDAAQGVAAGLAAQGLQPGQTVALMLPTGLDYLACFFGVMLARGIPVPIYPPARMSQIEEHLRRHAGILRNAGTVLIIAMAQAKAVAVLLQAAVPSLTRVLAPSELRAAPAAPRHHRPLAEDIAFLQYTSGSTGDPKGVVLTHANLLANIRALGQAAQVTPGDVFVSWLPLYHDMGLIGAWFGSLYHGMPLVLMPPLAFLARPARWLQAIARYRGTISAAPNFAYELCARHVRDAELPGLDLSSWRLALNGAEPVSAATLDAFAARFAACGFRRQALTPVYGLAESSVGLAFPPPGRGPRIDVIRRAPFARHGRAEPASAGDPATLSLPSCGRVLPGHAIRIVDETGAELPERCVGRLEFRGPSSTAGYYRNPEATRTLLRGAWLDSGDNAYLAQGEVYITGRVKDLIKRGGRNLYPYDLEEASGKLPGIRKGCVAVFASPDPATGSERLVIMAETRESDETVRARLRQSLNQTAIDVIGMPADDIVLAPPHSVPKTSSGKIRRLACRQAYQRGTADRAGAQPWLQAARLAAQLLLARARVGVRRAGAWAYGAWAWAVVGALALPCGGLIALLQQPALGRRLARSGARLLFRLTGTPLSASNIDRLPQGPHVLLVNHASYLDAIALTALLPAVPGYAFAVKREFEQLPAMRRLLTGLGALFVERLDARRGTEDVKRMAAALGRGEAIVVFPEGTFDGDAGLQPFHAGAFLAAAMAQAPLVVSGLRGTRTVLPADTWWPHRAPVEFEVGQVFVPSSPDWAATAGLSNETRAAMSILCREFARPE